MMFKYFKARRAEKQAAYLLYRDLVGQARQPAFYSEYGVADTIEGRFDMILLHLFLVDARLAVEGDPFIKLRRHMQEAMISDMDRSFREMGVGDMSVGKEMKKVGAAWLGRQDAYGRAMADGAEAGALNAALEKNLYDKHEDPPVSRMAHYMCVVKEQLAGRPGGSFADGSFTFPGSLKDCLQKDIV